MSDTAQLHPHGPDGEGDVTELLIERALWGLDEPSERRLLAELDGGDPGAFDSTVGALAVAMAEPEPMPAEVRRSLDAAAMAFVAARAEFSERSNGVRGPEGGPPPLRLDARTSETRGPTRPRVATWAGWAAAAAVLIFAWVFTRPDPVLTPADRMTRLANTAPDLVRSPWVGLTALGASAHPLDQGVGGELVWSDLRDEGYMKIRGISPNDPGEFQYQLWIFDATRPRNQLPQFAAEGMPEILTQRPVSGGVFDVPSSGEVVIPVDPQLPIGEGVIFAVTKEPPGGVVQSERDIVFLALRG